MTEPSIVVCSFYTDDDYYRAAAQRLATDLDALGVHHVIELLERAPGEQWPDICRKKIPFVERVCAQFPNARVFWMDVDCTLQGMPDFVRDFTADFIGFQRGFDTPLSIGYQKRARFWEPSFFGINATVAGRGLIAEAARLERTLSVRATDDYFLEEAWRGAAAGLSFQVIPSVLSSRSGAGYPDEFFTFGASGNVAQFKGSVVQHTPVKRPRRSVRRALKHRTVRFAKATEARLPEAMSRRLRTAADRAGVTDRLVTKAVAATPKRESLINAAMRAAQAGDADGLARSELALNSTARATPSEEAALAAAGSFLAYATGSSDAAPLPLSWWARPYPGNFGDWLSPLVVRAHTDRPLRFQQPSGFAPDRHLVAIGSIGRFIKPNSVVVGTGIAQPDTELATNARYLSVRGPLTAAALTSQGGPQVESFGDPGLLLSRVIPVDIGATNGRVAVVRHTNHRGAPLRLPADADEVSVLMSSPDHIREFVTTLAQYDAVVTSAMHVMIACHSYGIPCALVTFEGLEDAVPGSGMKYADYGLGAGFDTEYQPLPVPADLTSLTLRDLVTREHVSPAKLDEIEDALRVGLDLLAPAAAR
ncbi:polysaccharide pyruvyl transferase family protein [Demequina sp.]|uniref:polysaccharide pyruvyl transferase family protein n=1 Tax=Demequina sp. TaxID=2050685 RepID=UPI003D1332DE